MTIAARQGETFFPRQGACVRLRPAKGASSRTVELFAAHGAVWRVRFGATDVPPIGQCLSLQAQDGWFGWVRAAEVEPAP